MNPLYLRIDHARGYIEEENENKYMKTMQIKINALMFLMRLWIK